MTIGVGNLIAVSDYTSIKTAVDAIFGTGSGQSGYGQTVTSPSKVVGDTILQVEWVALRNDMVKCRQHQIGITVGSLGPTELGYVAGENLIIPDSTKTVSSVITQQYSDFAAKITTDKFLISSTQRTQRSLTAASNTSDWNNSITNSGSITGTGDQLRYFFNAGGSILFFASRSGGSGTAKDAAWSSLLSSAGLTMNHTGFYNLTTTDQLIYAIGGIGSYGISARVNSTRTSIIFSVDFVDSDTTNGDPNVTGTLTSEVIQNVPTGTNVAVTQLTGTCSFSGGTPTPSYSIAVSNTLLTQVQSFTISGTVSQLPVGSVLTLLISGTVVGLDFTASSLGPFTVTADTNGNYSLVLTTTGFTGNQPSKTFSAELYINGSATGQTTPIVTIAAKGTVAFGSTSTWTVPYGVTSITVNGVGGGGYGHGSHDSGYNTFATAGGPGGGISNYVTAVNAGDICSFSVGNGGGSGGYNTSGAATQTSTLFYVNTVLRFTALPGGGSNATNSPGAPGSGSIVPGLGTGSIAVGVAGGTNGGPETGYSVWNYTSPASGSPAIVAPSTVSNPTRRGLTEYPGWISISW